MDKEEALAICYTNLKGYKDKDLILTAQALQYLKNLPEYGSNDKVGKDVGVSGEVVREFLTLLDLPETIQNLFKQRKLTKLEQSRRLWQLARIRPELLEETAKAISDMSAWDGRYLIDYILRNPDISVYESKRAIIESKTNTEHEFHIIALLLENEYRALANEAHKHKVPVDVLVTSIVRNWLKSRGNNA